MSYIDQSEPLGVSRMSSGFFSSTTKTRLDARKVVGAPSGRAMSGLSISGVVMPRIRTVKPEFFLHEDLGALSPYIRLAFEGLWCQADREGKLKDRSKKLKVQILPYDDVNFEDILKTLAENGFITRYSMNGDNYIHIPTFLEHQRPNCNEQPSKIPDPVRKKSNQESTQEQPRTTPSSFKNDGKGVRERSKGKESMLTHTLSVEKFRLEYNSRRKFVPGIDKLEGKRLDILKLRIQEDAQYLDKFWKALAIAEYYKKAIPHEFSWINSIDWIIGKWEKSGELRVDVLLSRKYDNKLPPQTDAESGEDRLFRQNNPEYFAQKKLK